MGRTYSNELLKRNRSIFSLARLRPLGANMPALHHVSQSVSAGFGSCHTRFHGSMTLPELPEACRPRNMAEAYAVQAKLVAELAIDPAGWKIG